MIISFEKEEFEKDDITQLYPAAMIPTGVGKELTQISLEWYDTERKDIEAVKYAIFVHFRDKSVLPFYYENREKLEKAIENLANILNN